MPSPDELVTISRDMRPHEVAVAKSLLESADIEVFELDGAMATIHSPGIRPRMAVRGSDVEEAVTILKEGGLL